MAQLHGRFLKDPTATDVITFDGDPDVDSAGEICVCPDVAAHYSAEHRVDFPRELALYVTHGYLHLCGFDDTDAKKRKRMRAAELAAMKILEAATALPAFTLRSGS